MPHWLWLVGFFCAFRLSINAINQLQHGQAFGKVATSRLFGPSPRIIAQSRNKTSSASVGEVFCDVIWRSVACVWY